MSKCQHPVGAADASRRAMLQAGAIGMMGLGMAEMSQLRAMAQTPDSLPIAAPPKSVLFVFLTGGISQQDSFDLKPESPDTVRGEFQPIATRTPGMEICEHLPLLAQRSDKYALVRSMTSGDNGHGKACHMLLTGRLDLPPDLNLRAIPNAKEWPSLLSLVNYATRGKNHMPPSVVLPQPSVNENNNVRPGQYAGRLGPQWESWHVNIASDCPLGNGACPNCFRFEEDEFDHASDRVFNTPQLALPQGGSGRLQKRLGLLDTIEDQQRKLDRQGDTQDLDRHRQQAITVLTDPRARAAFDVANADAKTLDRYGRNKFGMSLLMGYRLIEAGVNMVQVNLGKNSSWDTHRRNFLNLRENLFPYFDQSLSALLDDLSGSGLLEDTLLVVTGEFGRTPKINKDAGRDHWSPVFTLLAAGAGVRGGNVIGASDKMAAYPATEPLNPGNLSATMFETLGIPRGSIWHDVDGRPHQFYHGRPISALF